MSASIEGRMVEVKAILEAFRAELYEATIEQRAERPGDDAVWMQLEHAADAVNGAFKFILDVQTYLDGARVRGWES